MDPEGYQVNPDGTIDFPTGERFEAPAPVGTPEFDAYVRKLLVNRAIARAEFKAPIDRMPPRDTTQQILAAQEKLRAGRGYADGGEVSGTDMSGYSVNPDGTISMPDGTVLGGDGNISVSDPTIQREVSPRYPPIAPLSPLRSPSVMQQTLSDLPGNIAQTLGDIRFQTSPVGLATKLLTSYGSRPSIKDPTTAGGGQYTATGTPKGEQPTPEELAGLASPQMAPTAYVSEKGIKDAYAAAMTNAEEKGKLDKAAFEAQLPVLEAKQKAEQAHQAEILSLAEQQKTNLRATQEIYKQGLKIMQDPANVIDPNRFWADKSTGTKILIALGMGFGGHGGSNVVADMVKTAIDNDINAQKFNANANIQRGKNMMEGAQGMFNMYREAGADELTAHKLAFAAGITSVQTQLDALAAKSGAEGAQNKAQGLSTQLGVMKAGALKDVEIHNANATNQANLNKYHYQMQYDQANQGAKKEIMDRAEGRLAAYQGALDELDLAQKAYAKLGPGAVVSQYWPGSNADKYNQYLPSFADTVATALGKGKASAAQLNLVQQAMSHAGSFKGTANAQFDAWRRSITAQYNAELATLGMANRNVSKFKKLGE